VVPRPARGGRRDIPIDGAVRREEQRIEQGRRSEADLAIRRLIRNSDERNSVIAPNPAARIRYSVWRLGFPARSAKSQAGSIIRKQASIARQARTLTAT